MKTCLLLLLPLPIVLALIGFLAFVGVSANAPAMPPFESQAVPLLPTVEPPVVSSIASVPQLTATANIELYFEDDTSMSLLPDGTFDILAVDTTCTFYQIDYNGRPAWVRVDDDIVVTGDINTIPVIELVQGD